MPQTRDTVVPIRLTEEEAMRLDNLRRKKGLGRSSFIRMKLLECMEQDERDAAKAEEN